MPPNLNSVHFKDFLFLSNWLNITHDKVQRSNLLTLIPFDAVGSETQEREVIFFFIYAE